MNMIPMRSWRKRYNQIDGAFVYTLIVFVLPAFFTYVQIAKAIFRKMGFPT